MPEEEPSLFRQLGRAISTGLTLVISTFVGLAMGWALDYKLFNGKTAPWLTMIFLILGIVAGFRELFKMAKQDDKKTL